MRQLQLKAELVRLSGGAGDEASELGDICARIDGLDEVLNPSLWRCSQDSGSVDERSATERSIQTA
ncbi:MAG: hypothetical protein KC502_20420 [Myxococcales bacterium]|nr:hypothetical protein [Myxococcales bacterium]